MAFAYDYSKDPLNFDVLGMEVPLMITKEPRYFTITTDSYISLCSRVYAALCAEDDEFADNVPESVFQYYAVILLWLRFADLQPSSMRSSQFLKEIYKLPCEELHVPLPLLIYLKGIGNFCDIDQCERQFMLPELPTHECIGGVKYTYGKISAKTHHYYEAFPAPGIAALRIQADIQYTKYICNANLFWDLPDDLRPDVLDSRIKSAAPTRNLLGWAPAQELTSAQLELCQLLDMKEFLSNKVSTLSSCTSELLRTISKYLCSYKNQTGGYIHSKEVNGKHICTMCTKLNTLSLNGSLVQGTFVEKRDKCVKFDRSAMYCDGSISLHSQFLLNISLIKGAIISGYRMIKESTGDRHCWSCYDFDEYTNVPETWIRSRNMVYAFGSVGKFQEIKYTTACVSKRILQNACILNSMIKRKSLWSIYV
ncbi:uncharacterized protein LOC124411431 [Diprion similis]|uniref:uncharacterized protein LOC124411431 n=1 Tax=Diprion similis TaxID=362088 RepID=UPI001EF7E3EF|nr:uncharacterized protein LOC124411431 [Diprion similis]